MPNDNQPIAVASYEREEFVVALPYAPAVRDRIQREFGLACELTDNRDLNLTLVAPRQLEQAAQVLRRAAAERMAHRDNDHILEVVQLRKRQDTSPLDDLMFCLRYDFAATCAGWIPAMGKNRHLHNVTGAPHLDGGAILNPVPATVPPPVPESAMDRGHGVRVGVLDTQLYPHQDLAGRYLARPDDLLETRSLYSRFAGHATFIAGLILRHAPAAELQVRHTLDDDHATTTLWDFVHKVMRFRDSGVQILNLSLGCYTADGEPPMVLQRAIQQLAPEIVIVAAAGNHGDPAEYAQHPVHPFLTPQTAFWPAALDDVLAVGADLDAGPDGPRPAPFSPLLPWVTYMAQGEGVLSTYLKGHVDIPRPAGERPQPFHGYARWSGTSFAAAIVTGELAALTKPDRSAWQAVAELRERAAKPSDDFPVRLFEG
jgi:membrane-anchored mycosin MYCP